LGLDVSKAVDLLEWHPILDFSEVVDWTMREHRTSMISPSEVCSQKLEHIVEWTLLQNWLDQNSFLMAS
jgi:hypothetical protein